MLIDCDTCRAGRHACRDCVVTHLLATSPAPGPVGRRDRDGAPERRAHRREPHVTVDGPALLDGPVTLDSREWAAVGVMARAGLLPPLRLVASDVGHIPDPVSSRFVPLAWASSDDTPDGGAAARRHRRSA